MEITREVIMKLTAEDIKELIIDHAYKNGVTTSSISFQINQHLLGDILEGAICKGKEIINPNRL
jgi:hypothetical protein